MANSQDCERLERGMCLGVWSPVFGPRSPATPEPGSPLDAWRTRFRAAFDVLGEP